MNHKKLNSLAVLAKAGNLSASWEVKSHFQSYIHMLSELNRNRLGSQESFETECFKIIDGVIERYDPLLGDFSQLVVNFIKRRLGRSSKRHKSSLEKHCVSFTEMPQTTGSQDGFTEYVVADDLAVVDERILLNERITGLAAGDPRKLAILNSWLDPDYNDSRTANLLAQTSGGKAESHRKFIGRFRTECQKALANAV